MLDVAGELDRHGAARAAHAEIAIEARRPRARMIGTDGEREHVVDDGRLAEQALVGGQRRLGADHAALALEAFEQRRLLAADIGAGADAHLHVEGVARAGDARAEHSRPCARRDGALHRRDGVRIFGADVDVALGRADGDAGDRHALDQDEGIALHDHAVGEGAAVALVGVADDVFLRAGVVGDGPPLDAGREAGAAAAAQAGLTTSSTMAAGPIGKRRSRPLTAAMRR